MNNIIESFFIAVLFDDKETKKSADKTQQTISDFTKRALTSLTALVSFDVLKGLAMNFEQNANKLGDIADKVGDNVENIDAFRKAVQYVNGDAEQFTSTLENMGQKLKKLNTNEGREFNRNLRRFGISIKDSEGYLKGATDLIVDYSDKYNKLTGQRRENFVKLMGIDESTEKLLKQGKDGVNQLVTKMYKFGVMEKEQVKIAKEFRTANRELEFSFGFLANKIGAFILPSFTKMANLLSKFVEFIQVHKDLTIAFFAGLATVITARLIPAFARLAIATLTNPFFLMVAAITALIALFAVLYEEFEIYKRTGESDFKPLFDMITNTTKAVKDFINENKGLIDVLKDLGIIVLKIIGLLAQVANFGLFMVFDSFVKFGEMLENYILEPILKILDALDILSKIKNYFGNFSADVKNVSEDKTNSKLNKYIKSDVLTVINAKKENPALQTQLNKGSVVKTNTIKDSNNQNNTINVYTNKENGKDLANEIKSVIPKNPLLNTVAFDNGSLS